MLDARLAIDAVGDDTFVGTEVPEGSHVFGGLLVAQALRAAATTVGPERPVHSLHASFVASGRGDEALRYRVERTRDGSSFATRRVEVTQAHGTVLVLTAGFQRDEEGLEFEVPQGLDVLPPEACPVGRYDNPVIESRDVPAGESLTRRAWFRPVTPLPVDADVHLQALAFLSDFGMTRAARQPHAHLEDDARRLSVSLDHGVWFHRPAKLDGWVLSEVSPIATGRGRGLALGYLRSRDGALLATVAQEVLLRER